MRAQVVLLYGTLYVIFMVAVWWPVKHYWVRPPPNYTYCAYPCEPGRDDHDAHALAVPTVTRQQLSSQLWL